MVDVEIDLAQPSMLVELAAFARATYAHAFGHEIGQVMLEQHLVDNMSNEQFEQMMCGDAFYLARAEGRLVGFAQLGEVSLSYRPYLLALDDKDWELRRLYVHADVQSMGIGSRLIGRVLSEPDIMASSNLYLTTWETNHGAQKLYQKHGFEKVGQIPEYDERGNLNGYEHIMRRKN